MEVDILHKPGVNLHFSDKHGLERSRHLIPRRDFFVPLRELTIWRNDHLTFFGGEGLFAYLIPALVELAFVLIRPFLRDMVRACVAPGAKYTKNGLSGMSVFCCPIQLMPFGHVFYQVVALFGRPA